MLWASRGRTNNRSAAALSMLKVPCHAKFTLPMFSNSIIGLWPAGELYRKESPSLTFPSAREKRKKLVLCDVTKGTGVSPRIATETPSARRSFIFILIDSFLFQLFPVPNMWKVQQTGLVNCFFY